MKYIIHLLTKDKMNNINISMSKINNRNKLIKDRIQKYFLCPILEQKHINNINKQLNK